MSPVRAAVPVNAVAMTFPPDPVWVRSAREAVRTAMSTVVPAKQDLIDTAMLLTSEAVTNAVMASNHSITPASIGFRARWTDDGALHVLVQDLGPGAPEETSPLDTANDIDVGSDTRLGTDADADASIGIGTGIDPCEAVGLVCEAGAESAAESAAGSACETGTEAEGGRGLLLITREATDWGVCRHGPDEGKSVWFSLS